MGGVVNLSGDLRKAVGDKTAKILTAKWEMRTVGDLLRHYPRRYVRHGELTDLASLAEGEDVTIVGRVVRRELRKLQRKPYQVFEVTVQDATGNDLKLSFFGTGVYRADKELQQGTLAMIAGRVGYYRGRVQLNHPDFEVIPGAASTETVEEYATKPIPLYPATKELASWKIKNAIDLVLGPGLEVPDPMPPELLARHRLISLTAALEQIHRPRDDDELAAARRRLKWDEAFYVQLALAQRRRAASALPAAPRPVGPDGLLAAFDLALPFTLTEGQRAVGEEIAADLARAHPMHRLLQGDVGAGKTVVALRAMLQVVDGGGQAALLAPTEVLAQQHHRSITGLLGPLAEAGRLGGADRATRVALLTGSQGAKARRSALLEAASGEAGIVVGTHALIQEHVQFADLGLIVVDEQHRFGVEQRDALREKVAGGRPHVLVMTATPIPRTVAMTVFGDLDTSVLRQLPAGRAPIATHVVPPEKPAFLRRAWERIREEAAQGRQAYIVCPRIGEGDAPTPEDLPQGDALAGGARSREGAFAGGARSREGALAREEGLGEGALAGGAGSAEGARPPLAVLELLPRLEGELLSGLRIGVLHGRLHPDEKDAVMRGFAAGELDVLLATTVVEVGVDVPNATVMMIMDADRFGVSQLHQLRGRVGRGSLPGLCLLVTDAEPESRSRERLAAVAATTDGFELSRLDLEQRREGDILGAAQSGRRSTLRLLTLLRDERLIARAREEATALVGADPELAVHPGLAEGLAELLDEDRVEYLEKA